MDDFLLDELGRSLMTLQKLGPLLDELIFPRQSVVGESAGVAARVPGPRSPASDPMIDLKRETERLIGWWCGRLVESSPEVGAVPADRSVVVRARWLHEHLGSFEVMPGAVLAAEDLIAQSRHVADVVDPPVSVDDPPVLEIGPVREIVAWCRHLGVQVSAPSVWRWVQQEVIPSSTAPDGRLLVALSDVMERARYGAGHTH